MALTAWSSANYLSTTSLPISVYPLLVSLWANRTSSTAASRTYVSLDDATHRYADTVLDGSNFTAASVYNGVANIASTSSTVTPSGSWYHGAGSYVSTTLRTAWHNGVAATDQTNANSPNAPTTFFIGKNGLNVEAYDAGDGLAEVSIWDLTGFTSGNITSLVGKLFNGGAASAGGNPLNITAESAQPWTGKLKGYWINSANTITDLSGNGKNLTMTGTLTNFASHPTIEAVTPTTSIRPRTTVSIVP